ncbi:MAG: SMI1/KNR4 family protein [Flavobacteriales bacterium]|nr:SMI1/KNR4 family protein [Flavobacteriales bacterium]
MNPVLSDLEDCLRKQFTPREQNGFLVNGNTKTISLEKFKEDLGIELPDLFFEYYNWLLSVEFENHMGKKMDLSDTYFNICSLAQILRGTKMWQEIQQDDPSREWKQGFVFLSDWDSSNQMVIDTKGIIGKPNCILYWHYAGGAEYLIEYENLEMYLKTKIELLKRGLYFPKDDNWGDFCYGNQNDQIKNFVRDFNVFKRVDF